jgi:hypothetical protein
MRKSFLTKEFSLEPTPGTMNMQEVRSFFTSKVLELEDVMVVGEEDITWFESKDSTQGIGLDNQNMRLDMFELKRLNHRVRMSPQQTVDDKMNYTKWEFSFDIKKIIRSYLFAQMKKNRTFTDMENRKTLHGSVNTAMYEYIDRNVLPRIQFAGITMYIRYYTLSELQENNVVSLQYNVDFRKDLLQLSPLSGETTAQFENRLHAHRRDAKVTNFQLTTSPDEETATMVYKQVQSSLYHKFDYYFDVVYKKS